MVQKRTRAFSAGEQLQSQSVWSPSQIDSHVGYVMIGSANIPRFKSLCMPSCSDQLY